MISQLAHLCIGAKDLTATEAFYRDVLGLEKVFDFIKDDRVIGFYFALGGRTFIEVFVQDAVLNSNKHGLRHLCLEVDHIEAFITRVRAQGWKVGDAVMGADNTWQTWLADPNGVDIEVQQYTDRSSQFKGGDAVLT